MGALNIALQSVTWRGSTLKSKHIPKNDLILSNPIVDKEAISNKLFAKKIGEDAIIDVAEKDEKSNENKSGKDSIQDKNDNKEDTSIYFLLN